jgi:hypothetical protein
MRMLLTVRTVFAKRLVAIAEKKLPPRIPATRVMRVAIPIPGIAGKGFEHQGITVRDSPVCRIDTCLKYVSWLRSKFTDCDEAMCHVESLAPTLDEV